MTKVGCFQCNQCLNLSRHVISEAFFCPLCLSIDSLETVHVDDGLSLRELTLERLKARKGHTHGRSYKVRQEALESLSFSSYGQYLQSEIWKTIRMQVLERDCMQCCLCNKPARCVHHTGYSPDILVGKANDALVSLCFACHKNIEFCGKKLISCEQTFWKLMRELGYRKPGKPTGKRRRRRKKKRKRKQDKYAA